MQVQYTKSTVSVPAVEVCAVLMARQSALLGLSILAERSSMLGAPGSAVSSFVKSDPMRSSIVVNSA